MRLCWFGPFISSHYLARFDDHGLCESRDITFLFVAWPYDQIVAWLCRWGSLILSYQPAQFGGHMHCDNGNAFFICHVTTWLTFHLNLWVEFPHAKIWEPWVLWKWKYNVFRLSCNHGIEVSRDYVDGIPSS